MRVFGGLRKMELLQHNAKNPITCFLKQYKNVDNTKAQRRYASKILKQINRAMDKGEINPRTDLFKIMKHELHLKPQQYETELKLYWQSGERKGERIKGRLPNTSRLLHIEGYGEIPLNKNGAMAQMFLGEKTLKKYMEQELKEKQFPIN